MSIRFSVTTASLLLLGLAACNSLPMGGHRVTQASGPCADQTVQIYFEPQSAEVGPDSVAVIKAAAHAAQGCKVRAVDVIGLADATGAPDANLELSKVRAQAVSKALSDAGLPAAQFRLTAAGAAGAVNGQGLDRPLRRRVDVVLALAPQ